MYDARTRDPLDVVLCHGCAAVVEVVTRHDDDGTLYTAECACGYDVATGSTMPPLTVRDWLRGVDYGDTYSDVRMGRLVHEIARRLGAA